MKVKLNNAEMLSGVIAGARRMVASIQKNLSDSTGCTREWSKEIEGALAEVAVAKTYGLYWNPDEGLYKAKDVGQYHVRQTELDDGRLIIRPGDPDGVYVLVTGKHGNYEIVGKCQSEDVKKDEYKKAPNGRPGAWFIPRGELESV